MSKRRSERPQSGSEEPARSTAVAVRAALPSLPPAEQRVAELVLGDPAAVAGWTISELARRADTSETTVSRFCRALGFPGYPHLRLALATEAGRRGVVPERELGGDIGPTDELADVVAKIAYADARAVEDTAAQLDVGVLERVVSALVTARRVDVFGVGASAFVAADFQQKLHRIGRTAFAWNDSHIGLTSAAVLRPGDVAVGISHTGTTEETLAVLTEAGRHGATTVALTNFPGSPVARAADHVLTTAARETTFRSGAMASRLAQLTVVDCLFVGVAQRTFDETTAALAATYEAVLGRRVSATRRRRR